MRNARKPAPPRKLSPSALALDAVLKEESPEAEALHDAVRNRDLHRTMLWRFRTGHGAPELQTARRLHQLTNGRVPIDGWVADDTSASLAATGS